jgi:hypothetical protein
MATDIEITGVAPITGDGELPPPSVVEQWGRKALFDCTPIQKILEDEKDRTTFWNAGISGRAFLRDGDVRYFWLHQCGLPIGLSGDLAELAQTIKDIGKEKSRGNAIHLGSDEPANTFTVQSPLAPRDGKLRHPSVVERSTEEEFQGIGSSARLWEIPSVTDEDIKSENSRAVCDPKASAN